MILIDANKKVHAINEFMRRTFGVKEAEVADLNLGKILKCLNEVESPGSCMKGEKCSRCMIMNAALSTIKTGAINRDQFDITLKVGKQKEHRILKITSAPVEMQSQRFALLILEDFTELSYLRNQLKTISTARKFIGQDPKVEQLREKIHILADVDVPVMIQGESGTGKELIAKAIHNEGLRGEKPFVAVNCGAIPETLLESELFGHVKGAFTGAIRDKKGRFEIADGGTIFLDEIGDISPAMQVKLLRVLQEGAFERVGGEETIHVDVRIISATNKDIKSEIKAGRFREDLYYRLCVVPLFIPPLRERPGDIPLIAEAILRESAVQLQRSVERISSEAMNALVRYSWPGNVRELQNAIQYALVHCRSNTIHLRDLPPNILDDFARFDSGKKRSRKHKLNKIDVEKALRQSGGNKVVAAKILGVGRATLYRFLGTMKN
jgi:transcriptional regulator with PAS, ATPase and Fis domain